MRGSADVDVRLRFTRHGSIVKDTGTQYFAVRAAWLAAGMARIAVLDIPARPCQTWVIAWPQPGLLQNCPGQRSPRLEYPMTRWLTIAALIVSAHATAADQHKSPTLQRIADSGVFRIGFVPDAPPMSFIDANGKTGGYSIDLCRHIAEATGKRLDLPDLRLEFVPLVAPADRLSAVADGNVDIECGATTVTLARRNTVDFTLMTFVTGGTILSRKRRPIPGLEDLPGKRIAVIKGTTTEDALLRYARLNDYEFTIVFIATHDEGVRLLNEGKVDGYASDRSMLIGQVFRNPGASDYVMARQVFSHEPYSLMIRRGDTDFRLLADSALAALYSDARIRRLYHTWFGRYGEPLSPVVEAMYELQAVSE